MGGPSSCPEPLDTSGCRGCSGGRRRQRSRYVDGKPATGDPRAIELVDQHEIAIVIGTPPAEIPKTGDFSNA
jgi:hypothetical protein